MGIVNTYYLLKKYVDNALSTPLYLENANNTEAEVWIGFNNIDAHDFKYSTDNVNWTTTVPHIPAGGRVYIKATATHWGDDNIWQNKLNSSQPFNVGGNIMSLFYGDYFTGAETTFPDPTREYILGGLFSQTGVIDASELMIPVQYMPAWCCRSMFLGCESLTAGIASLPATQLGHHCYQGMYENATALTTANTVLPALHVPQNAYDGMYAHCADLANPVEIMAETGDGNGMAYMFSDCVGMTSITVHLNSWNTDVTNTWMERMTGTTGVITKPAALTIPSDSESGCPTGWTTVDIQ